MLISNPTVSPFSASATVIKNSGCPGHRAVFDGEGSEPGPRRRELLHKIQQRRRLDTLAGGDH